MIVIPNAANARLSGPGRNPILKLRKSGPVLIYESDFSGVDGWVPYTGGLGTDLSANLSIGGRGPCLDMMSETSVASFKNPFQQAGTHRIVISCYLPSQVDFDGAGGANPQDNPTTGVQLVMLNSSGLVVFNRTGGNDLLPDPGQNVWVDFDETFEVDEAGVSGSGLRLRGYNGFNFDEGRIVVHGVKVWKL